jgi:hypothetical protein
MLFFKKLFNIVAKEIIYGKEYGITKIICINGRHKFTNHEEKKEIMKINHVS